MRKILLILPLLLISARCSPSIEPHIDAKDNSEFCDEGCAHLETLVGQDGEMGCYESRPLSVPDAACSSDAECEVGKCINAICVLSCTDFCVETIKQGRYMGPECWTTVNSCEEIETKCR